MTAMLDGVLYVLMLVVACVLFAVAVVCLTIRRVFDDLRGWRRRW